jgi:Bardet-Biedl syndrome 2 protein
MYTKTPSNMISTKSSSYVTFRITERVQRICIWINQNFLLDEEIELESEDAKDLQIKLCCLRDHSILDMTFGADGQVKFCTKDIRLAGDLIQSLAIYLNLTELQVSCIEIFKPYAI